MALEGLCIYQGGGTGGANLVVKVGAGVPYRIHNRGLVPITVNSVNVPVGCSSDIQTDSNGTIQIWDTGQGTTVVVSYERL